MPRIRNVELDAMIEESVVDSNSREEQLDGMFNLIEERLALPFTTIVLGLDVTVTAVAQTDNGDIAVTCTHGPYRQRIGILDLPLPKPAPEGAIAIEAYRRWASGR